MGSVAQIEDEKKELVRVMYRLDRQGILLMVSTKCGVMVHNRSESYFVTDVNSKQEHDTLLVELKESIIKKSIEAFSWGR